MSLMASLVILLGVAPGSRAESAQPKVVLVPECHGYYPYGFEVGLTGFPPNQPFDAVLHYSGTDYSYTGFLKTDLNGGYALAPFGGDAPLGDVTATVTTTINGAQQTYSSSLNDPCDPPLSLTDAMCGDGDFSTYLFATESDCAGYVQRLQNGTAQPSVALQATCDAGQYGFTGLVLGVPPGTSLAAHIVYDGQVLDIGSTTNRFGAIGPIGFGFAGPPNPVSATLTGDGVSLTATLTDFCRTTFARAGSDPTTGTLLSTTNPTPPLKWLHPLRLHRKARHRPKVRHDWAPQRTSRRGWGVLVRP